MGVVFIKFVSASKEIIRGQSGKCTYLEVGWYIFRPDCLGENMVISSSTLGTTHGQNDVCYQEL